MSVACCCSTRPLSECQERRDFMSVKCCDVICSEAECPRNVRRRAVSEADPNHFRRRAQQHAETMKVLVFSDKNISLRRRAFPYENSNDRAKGLTEKPR
jgi:hypothetical protein